MRFIYGKRQWLPCPTAVGGNCFFHSVFGENRDDEGDYFDVLANVRRMQWSAFLTYFENKTKPPCLEEQLQKCLDANLKFQHLLTDKDDPFGEYIEDVIRSEHRILLEELPVLATLENVRIVLFIDDNPVPKVFTPNSDLLGDYPLENKNPLTEAVVYVTGTCFFQLRDTYIVRTVVAQMASDPIISQRFPNLENPSSSGTSKMRLVTPQGTSSSLDTFKNIFTKHEQVVNMSGFLYQINLLTVFLINGLRKFRSWRLATQVRDAGYFDDVIFEVLPLRYTILVQAQFKMKYKKINYKDLVDVTYKDQGFNLPRYYFSYQKIKLKYIIKNVVICTNIDINSDLKRFVNQDKLNEKSVFYFEGIDSFCYTFNETFIYPLEESLATYARLYPSKSEGIFSRENIRQFLNDLQIITSYPSKGNFDQVIEKTISSMGYSDKFESRDYSKYVNKKMTEWFDETHGRYLTQLDAKAYFCGFRSKKFCEKLCNIKLDFKTHTLTLLNTAKRILHIIPHKEDMLNLIKVYHFLQKEQVKSLFINPCDPDNIQKQTIEAFEAPKYTFLVMYVKTNENWVIHEMYNEIIWILQKYSDKKVILIAETQNKLIQRIIEENNDWYQKLDENISIADFTEQSQERLLEEVVTLFEINL